MAFSYTVTRVTTFGDRRVAFGTWTTTNPTTSGSIVTGLQGIEFCSVTNKTGERAGTAIDDSTTAGTIALSGVTTADVGEWFAIGY